jgi:hypothetical protein
MKIIIFSLLMSLTTTNLFAKEAKKSITLPSTVHSMSLQANGEYRLDLNEHAAAYTASEKFTSCLQKSINEKKVVKITVDPVTLKVLDCKAD